ncbi:MAG: class I mannose-6-phosphate isomerase, partial [Oscillospiraceae bacterium]|nr:class I mannose-6-phosphate isomerase [Oscillospiraceae bacterium]
LSVQVHPDNDYAMRVEGEYGKTEMWYIVDADEGAELLYGFKHEITKEEFRERIENNTLLEVTESVPVKKGDVFFIRSGTLHAIGKGILIAEIQQNSNTTYRIYDYGRLGTDGKPRELHIEKALDVTSLSPAKPYPPTEWKNFSRSASNETEWREKLLSSCEYFSVKALEVTGSAWLEATESTFVHILVLSGETIFSSGYGKDHTLKLTKGSSVFVPAGYGHFELTGDCSAVMTYIE